MTAQKFRRRAEICMRFAARVNELLGGAAAPQAQPGVDRKEAARTEERRVVTVLVSDVAGSTRKDRSS